MAPHPPALTIHFAVTSGTAVRPLCGDWGASTNWTRVRAAVTCPQCIEALGADASRFSGARE